MKLKILILVLVFMIPIATAINVEKGTTLTPSCCNVSFVMDKNYTFSHIVVRNDSIQLNDTNISFVPQDTTLYVNLSLQNFSITFIQFNVSVDNSTANPNGTVRFWGGGIGLVPNASIFYN